MHMEIAAWMGRRTDLTFTRSLQESGCPSLQILSAPVGSPGMVMCGDGGAASAHNVDHVH